MEDQLPLRAASAQSHFNEFCELLGQPGPTDADPTGEFFCFNKHLSKIYGGKGFADVWKRGYFAWEYKGKHKDLKAAYKQINDYREDLLNPPLLVVCDTNIFQIHTNFQNTVKRVYEFDLDDLGKNRITAKCPLPPLDVLRALFGDYNVLRPDRTDAYVTQEAARLFATLAERLEIEQKLSATPDQIANFLIRILFCIFADAIGLLPDHLFRKLLELDRFYPRRFLLKLPQLFAAMSAPDGIFGMHNIRHFNGGLFRSEDAGDLAVVQLDKQDMAVLHKVAHDYNWAHVAPAIFGTLFERSLNKERRSLIGAHYTGEEDILLLIEPVVMRPLQQRWEDTKAAVLQTQPSPSPDGLLHSNPQAEHLLAAFFDHLSTIRILDPACGSGNFLYVALRRLLDLWLEARDFAAEHKIQLMQQYALTHLPSPRQLLGIEVDDYAHRLASIVVWIGFLQWKHEHNVNEDQEPVLDPLSTIEHSDAILRYDAEGNPYEPAWRQADFIIGNPPFLGGTLMKRQLGDSYCDDLRELYKGRVEGAADLVTYWFEKGRGAIEAAPTVRVGLLATQGIRGGANQKTLRRIIDTGTIFWAISDKEWTLNGAMVHTSLIAYSGAQFQGTIVLDGKDVSSVFADLTATLDTTRARRLSENVGLCFRGTEKHGAFDLSQDVAIKMLTLPVNPNGRPNSDVIKRYINAIDIVQRENTRFVIDFGIERSLAESTLYEIPFEYLKHHVYPVRLQNRRDTRRNNWWLHGETNPGMRLALANLSRYIATPRVSKHRLFSWVRPDRLADSALCVFAREDNYFFGVLHSLPHEVWARAQGTQLREVESGFRYTPQTTFPFPWPPNHEPTSGPDAAKVEAIAAAARTLVQLRDAWLNPPDTPEADLKKRTLTNLYNARPTWLDNAHRTLDAAVFEAYGWPDNLTTPETLARLLALNHERAASSAPLVAGKPQPESVKPPRQPKTHNPQ